MPVNTLPPTYRETIMSKYIDTYIELAESDVFGDKLVRQMGDKFDLRGLPTLVMFCGDGDFYMHSLFKYFKISSLVRATYNVKSTNYAVDKDFLVSLGDKAFWNLSLKQVLKLSAELKYLFPDRFAYLDTLEERYIPVGAM